jgi:DNA-binding response OmpR family regulator
MPPAILLVEDDPDIFDILYYILVEAGYQVIKSNGHDVIQEVIKMLPDLVLLDYRLYMVWGSDICRELKACETTRDIPVVMISAAMQLEEVAKKAGADDYLRKPFDLEALLDKITTILPQDKK